MIDYDGTRPIPSKTKSDDKNADGKSRDASSASSENTAANTQQKEDDVFSDSEGEEEPSPSRNSAAGSAPHSEPRAKSEHISSVTHQTENLSLGNAGPTNSESQTSREVKTEGGEKVSTTIPNMDSTDIKAIAADASVFSFGDDEDYESE